MIIRGPADAGRWSGLLERLIAHNLWLIVADPQRERRPLTDLTLRRDRPLEQFHCLLRDRQPQPCAFRLFAALSLYLTELIEDVGEILWWDADSGVGDGQLQSAIGSAQRQGDRAGVGCDRLR